MGHVEVWGDPESDTVGEDGAWCDDPPRISTETIYHREPCRVVEGEGDHPGEWFCTRCGSSTWADHEIGIA